MYVVYLTDYRVGHLMLWHDMSRLVLKYLRPSDCVWLIPGTLNPA